MLETLQGSRSTWQARFDSKNFGIELRLLGENLSSDADNQQGRIRKETICSIYVKSNSLLKTVVVTRLA